MKTAIVFAEKHFHRWMTELIDAAVADGPIIGEAMLRRLYAIYAGDEPPEVDDVTIEPAVPKATV